MVAESWGTMKLAYRALELCTPHVFFDTTGCAFTFACAKVLAGCRVAAYVHYPTISTDMLSLIWKRRPSYNHDVDIAKSRLTTIIKLLYYVLFAVMYGSVGSMADLVLVNSSWTYSHISFLWRGAVRRIKIVFPPCDVTSLMNLSVAKKRERLVLSIGQFRPEKDHELQIRAFSRLRENNPDMHDVKLILLGSCRGKGDEDRVEIYRKLVKSLGLADCVDFVLNQPYSVVKEWLGRASVGLHTMWNEHFGIGVVEMMAAGLLTIAHNSGGPKADIIVPFKGHRTGFLAGTVEEYADAMLQALNMDPADMLEMRGNARASSLRFSDEVFCSSLQKSVAESILLR
jgi:alpha-1,2-mannosyltransferase